MAAPPQTLRLVDEPEPNPNQLPVTVDVGGLGGDSFENGALKTENDDGSVTIDTDPPPEKTGLEDEWFGNLADKIGESELSRIATELLTGIQSDDDSRKEWLETRAQGLKLLGLKIETPQTDVGMDSAPVAGMSTVRHPLLLESVLRFQANARGELLPASGPVKVRNDTPTKPKSAEPAPPPLPPPPTSNSAEAYESPTGRWWLLAM